MERGPSQPERHGTDPEAKDKKRKSKKRGLAVPLPVETDAAGKADTAEKPAKPSAVDEALARLAVARKEAAEAAKESDEPAAEVATDAEPDVQETTEPEAEAEAVDEPESVSTSESDDAEAYEPLPGYELEPTELGAGEVVIQLQGDAPVAERVISLHEPVAPQSETVEAEPVVAEVQPVSQVSQRAPEAPPSSAAAEAPLPAVPRFAAEAAGNVPATPAEASASASAVQRPEAVAAQHGAEVRPVNKQEIEDALYRATRVGEHRGALSGLLVGGAVEHFRHKGREKKAEKRFKQQTKQLAEQRESSHFFYGEQARQQAEQNRRLDTLEHHAEAPATKPDTSSTPEQPAEQQLAVPEGHRIETSAWHTIEVDAKTGKAVENPTFAYGREYYRERVAEAAPVQQRNAAAGEVALVAAATSTADDSSPSAIPDATTQGPPPRQSKQTATHATKATVTMPKISTTPLWPWIVTLLAILLCLLFLLR